MQDIKYTYLNDKMTLYYNSVVYTNSIGGHNMQSVVDVENNLNDKIHFIRYNAIALGKIEEINIKFLDGLKLLENEGNKINEKYYDRINELSDLAENKLCITNIEDFNKVLAFIEMSDMLITRGIKDIDEEPMITGFYNLKNNLNKLNIFTQ